MDPKFKHNPCHTEQEAVVTAAKKRAMARHEYARQVSRPAGQEGKASVVVDAAAAKTARQGATGRGEGIVEGQESADGVPGHPRPRLNARSMILKILLTIFFSLLSYLIFKGTGILGLAFLVLVFGLLTTWFPRRR